MAALAYCATLVILALCVLVGYLSSLIMQSHCRERESIQGLMETAMGYLRARDLPELSQHLLDKKYTALAAHAALEPAVNVSADRDSAPPEFEFVTLEDGTRRRLDDLEPL